MLSARGTFPADVPLPELGNVFPLLFLSALKSLPGLGNEPSAKNHPAPRTPKSSSSLEGCGEGKGAATGPNRFFH